MSSSSIDALTQQMKVMASLASGQSQNLNPSVDSQEASNFQEALVRAIRQVNEEQNLAQANVQKFALGENNVSLEDVMISLQKANLSFQTMIAVRNRLVDAYKEVTNLQL
jgi:flagellar hook-basal body complex protein FliE